MSTNGFSAKTLSREAKAACKALHFTPRYWEPVNAGQSVADLNDNQPVLHVWNSRREIVLTVYDLNYAARYLV